MARFSAEVRTAAGSTITPLIAVYSSATLSAKLRELGVANTTSTAVAIRIVKLTSAGTASNATILAHDPDATTDCLVKHTFTGDPTVASGGYGRTVLGAAVGAGWTWTWWNDSGLRVPVGTANGIGIIISTGTGQPLDAYLTFDV